jgi:hypothetical protein
MPGCAIHFELAARVLRAWDVSGADSPISPIDPEQRSAFILGSLGPDLGYLPGEDGLLADLAHCVRPADLARNFIGCATTSVERAFAWGWATHGTDRLKVTHPDRLKMTHLGPNLAVLGKSGKFISTAISCLSSLSSTRGSDSSRHSSRKCGSGV